MKKKPRSINKVKFSAVAIKQLRTAFRNNDLALYIGAGVSADSGIPMWRDLVLNVFLNSIKISSQNLSAGFYHSIRATEEHWFSKNIDPLEIAAREIRNAFKTPDEFVNWVRFGLYNKIGITSRGSLTTKEVTFQRRNKTLMAIIRLCRKTKPGKKGISKIINYNFDGLIETMLGAYPYQAIWKKTKLKENVLPIYHVHGYLPVAIPFSDVSPAKGSLADEIILTEDQYHKAMEDSFSWSNLIQLQAMSSSVVLTIGLSLSDPNLRRLLDLIRNSPYRPKIYAVLKKHQGTQLDETDFEQITNRTLRVAKDYNFIFNSSFPAPDMKTESWRNQVKITWSRIAEKSFERQNSVLKELGIEPIWCEDYKKDIPALIDQIVKY